MAASLNINDILSHVKKLDKEDQRNLLQRLVLLIKKADTTKASMQLSTLTGLGGDVWKDTNIDNYIDEERQW